MLRHHPLLDPVLPASVPGPLGPHSHACTQQPTPPQDGTLVTVQGDAPPAAELPPTAEELAAAEAAVTDQAAAVRALKEGGLNNQVGGGACVSCVGVAGSVGCVLDGASGGCSMRRRCGRSRQVALTTRCVRIAACCTLATCAPVGFGAATAHSRCDLTR